MKCGYKVLLFLLVILTLCSCTPYSEPDQPSVSTPVISAGDTPDAERTGSTRQAASNTSPEQAESEKTENNSLPQVVLDGTELQVIFFDVGQADCILIKTEEHAMLIDAGNTGQDDLILGYLSKHGVKSLDFLVATHPHADHIGAMSAVIRGMDSIGTLLMPDVIHTTQTFERLLDAIEEKNIPVEIPGTGDTFALGNARIQALAPNSGSYSELNDYSIVLRLEYGQTVFLFTGDAEELSENEQLSGGRALGADVLKIGHHGSRSSTSKKYLESVSPDYAVISCGKDNTYGHPHNETLEKLAAMGIALYRTDENGSVIFTTDGNVLTVSAEREMIPEAPKASETPEIPESSEAGKQNNITESAVLYIGNVNSKIFHLPTCGTLPAEKNRIHFDTREAAVNGGYRACKKCHP